MPTAPALTKTSGSNVNPMRWSGAYTSVIVGVDYIRCRWRVNGGAWTYETDHLFTSDDYYDSQDGAASFTWPSYLAYTFPGGALVEAQEGILRGGITTWSSILSDTMVSAITYASISPATYYDKGYGSSATNISGLTIQSGDKVVVYIYARYNGAQSVTSITANSGAITFTKAGQSSTANTRAEAWYADTSGVTTLNLTVNLSGSTQSLDIAVIAIRNAAAGGPNTYGEDRAVTNQDPHSLTGGTAPAIGGLKTFVVGTPLSSGLSIQFSNATQISNDGVTAGNTGLAVAATGVSTTPSIRGQAGSGPSYNTLRLLNQTWSQ